jgi:hypothetical protein
LNLQPENSQMDNFFRIYTPSNGILKVLFRIFPFKLQEPANIVIAL